MEHCLPCLHLLPLVCILDFQFACELAEDFPHLRELCHKRLGHSEYPVFERLPEGVLHLALGVHVAGQTEMGPEHF